MQYWIILLLFITQPAPATEISIIERKDQIGSLILSILDAAEEISDIDLVKTPVSKKYTTDDWRTDILSGATDVMYTVDHPDLYDLYQPIKIPLMKGMLGNRGALIRKDDVERIGTIKTYDDLIDVCTRMRCVSGKGWGDTYKLIQGGVPVEAIDGFGKMRDGIINGIVEGYYSHGEYHHYTGEKYDLFFRGLCEGREFAQQDIQLMSKAFGGDHRTYDPRRRTYWLMGVGIRYSNPMYFWVKRGNQETYQVLTEALTRLEESGRLDEIINATPMWKVQSYFVNQPGFVWIDLETRHEETTQ